MSDRLKALFNDYGQSPWLDNLKRSYITSGELMGIRNSGIRGLTSNPTIFQKAIQGSEDYSEQFTALVNQKLSPIDCYWQLVLRDINSALEIFEPLYESSSGLDGFVSVEVDPSLAHEQSKTLLAARELDELEAALTLMSRRGKLKGLISVSGPTTAPAAAAPAPAAASHRPPPSAAPPYRTPSQSSAAANRPRCARTC